MDYSAGRIDGDGFGRNNAAVRGSWGANVLEDDYFMNTERSFISGSIMNVRKAAEDFRSEHSDDLDDIDQADLCSRLSQPFRPHYDWANIGNYADERHRGRWDTIARSKELFDFAYHGRQLYDTIFPPGKDLRGWLDKAPPGLRINIIWRPTTGAEWMPHVPWGLIYTGEVKRGVPVNPTAFWGLRYRLGYSAYPPGAPSKALVLFKTPGAPIFFTTARTLGTQPQTKANGKRIVGRPGRTSSSCLQGPSQTDEERLWMNSPCRRRCRHRWSTSSASVP